MIIYITVLLISISGIILALFWEGNNYVVNRTVSRIKKHNEVNNEWVKEFTTAVLDELNKNNKIDNEFLKKFNETYKG